MAEVTILLIYLSGVMYFKINPDFKKNMIKNGKRKFTSIKLLFDLYLHYLYLLYNDDGGSYFLNCPE